MASLLAQVALYGLAAAVAAPMAAVLSALIVTGLGFGALFVWKGVAALV